MSDKKDNDPDEPEVIIVPPEDQDIMPPEDRPFVDAEATPVEDVAVKGRSRTGTWIALLVVAAFVGGFVAWPKLSPTLEPWLPESLKPGSSRLVEVTKALDELAVRIATLKNNAIGQDVLVDLEDRIKLRLSDLQKRIAELAARPELPGDFMELVGALNSKIEETATGLKQDMADLRAQLIKASASETGTNENTSDAVSADEGGLFGARLGLISDALADLSNRVAELENHPAQSLNGQPAARQTATSQNMAHEHGDLAAEVSALKSLTSDLLTRLSIAEAGLAVVAEANTRTNADNTSTSNISAALVVAAGQLRGRVESGQAYKSDFKTVQSLVGDNASLAPALSDLRSSTDGVPALSVLMREFADTAPAMLAANRSPANGWMEKIGQRLASLVTVRRTGHVDGDDAAARIARAENHLASGDLAASVAELKSLPAPVALVAAPWLQRASLRLKALAALEQLTRHAVQQLAQPSEAAE
ncbi:MAG: hypothetical protein HOE62_21795 [Alphaproteobacteria bacterium]|jgi:hypothetical protein|nr:hypothetical protein [Alphaproteobacteria bacterium]MBT5160020.1 hypothetical protein [Alphaproteobacteria bacterium]MBT5919975.1 hypothetical protein [Alphaproteobacteria bacterium]MBT6384867.1 hypothetical protein [Alphaproteobacteria bacterium]